DFTRDVPINDFPGVGRAFGKKMQRYGIRTVGEAAESPHLFESWGRGGRDLYARLTGRDGEGVSPRRSRKGIGMSRSMDRPIRERAEFYRRIRVMVRHWTHTIARTGVNPTTFYFSIGYEGKLRSKKQYTVYRLFNEHFITAFALEKFRELDVYPNARVTYIAMSATKFLHHDPKSVDLFTFEADRKMQRLDGAVTKMRERYGLDILRHAAEMGEPGA
ncbi:MAG: DNA polymerase IV, partial [Campylobacterales bacterium]